MPKPKSRRVISRDGYDAVLLDLDGVIADTAKHMFDEYLRKRDHGWWFSQQGS